MALLCLPGFALGAFAQDTAQWRRNAEVSYSKALDRMRTAPNNYEALWQFARSTFDLAEYSTNATERASLAEEGIKAAREAVRINSGNAAGHYYLGLNLGQLARTRYLSALKLVDDMEHEFMKARDLDPGFDNAGPYRTLGLLYRDAPAIGSIGSHRKAQQNLHKAVDLAPLYPENRLNLIESEMKWGDRNGALREFRTLEDKWEESRKKYSDPSYSASWADWETRRSHIAQRLKQERPGIKSPRAQ